MRSRPGRSALAAQPFALFPQPKRGSFTRAPPQGKRDVRTRPRAPRRLRPPLVRPATSPPALLLFRQSRKIDFMRYNVLGETGLFVSELCLGTMTFGGGEGMWQQIGALQQE